MFPRRVHKRFQGHHGAWLMMAGMFSILVAGFHIKQQRVVVTASSFCGCTLHLTKRALLFKPFIKLSDTVTRMAFWNRKHVMPFKKITFWLTYLGPYLLFSVWTQLACILSLWHVCLLGNIPGLNSYQEVKNVIVELLYEQGGILCHHTSTRY